MKRHAALIPLSHDHHHALVEARRLRQAADADAAGRRDAVDRFLRFFSTDTIRHFREEEETLFPRLAGEPELLVRALLDHQRLHALVRDLTDEPAQMRELADVLEAHVRLEERELFPLIEETVALGGLDVSARQDAASAAVDLLAPKGRGPLWGTETEELNATLLAWEAGAGAPEHVNAQRDVVLVFLEGSATVTLGGEPHVANAGDALVIEKGCARSLTAGPAGVRYLSIHRRRSPLQIARRGE